MKLKDLKGLVDPKGSDQERVRRLGNLGNLVTPGFVDACTNPWIKRAAEHTLRGTPANVFTVKALNEGIQWEHNGKKHSVLRFDVGNTSRSKEIIIAESIKDAVCVAVSSKPITYTESGGMFTLRKALAEIYGINPDEIFFVNGVTEAVMFASLLFANSNSNIVLTKPVYPPWAGVLLLNGVDVRMAERLESSVPDLESIESKLDSGTRAVTLISADNPTGLILGMETVEGVAQLLQKHILSTCRIAFLIVDDIYAEYIPPERRNNYFAVSEQYGIPMLFMSGIDKTLGTGFHGGYLIVHVPEVLSRIRETILDKVRTAFAMYLGANALTQYAMLAFLNDYEHIRSELEPNFRKFSEWSEAFKRQIREMNGIQYYYGEPTLPLYHWLRLPPGVDSINFTHKLVMKHGLGVTAGAPFGVPDAIRVVMVEDPVQPVNVARILNEFIKAY